MKILFFLGILVWSVFQLSPGRACPVRCTCTSIRSKGDRDQDDVDTPRIGQGRKVICSGDKYSPISSVAEIRNLPLDTVIL